MAVTNLRAADGKRTTAGRNRSFWSVTITIAAVFPLALAFIRKALKLSFNLSSQDIPD
jgi:hypothetical protein